MNFKIFKLSLRRASFVAMLTLVMLCNALGAEAKSKSKEAPAPPCSGAEYLSNSEFLRATSFGVSANMNFSKRMAQSAATRELAVFVDDVVAVLLGQYAISEAYENPEMESALQDVSRRIINQKFGPMQIICAQDFKNENGGFTSYITVQTSSEEVLKGLYDALSTNNSFNISYEKFKHDFNREISNMTAQE